jgi:AbiV family abortive infection protein
MKATTASKRIAERYVGPLNESQTAQAIAAVRANVYELIAAARALADAGIYSKSCAFSILAIEESQKVSLLLYLLNADTPDEQRQIWKEFRNHKEKHNNIRIDLPSSEIVEKAIAPDITAAEMKAKEAPDPDMLEELKQALIYSDCIMDANGLPQWSSPVGIQAEAHARWLLDSAREAADRICLFTEEELRVWKKHMGTMRSKSLKKVLDEIKECEAEIGEPGLRVPK